MKTVVGALLFLCIEINSGLGIAATVPDCSGLSQRNKDYLLFGFANKETMSTKLCSLGKIAGVIEIKKEAGNGLKVKIDPYNDREKTMREVRALANSNGVKFVNCNEESFGIDQPLRRTTP